MPTTRHVIALFAATVVAAAACKAGGPAKPQTNASVFHADDRIPAGGVLPAANALSAPRPAKLDPDAGANLFSAMNCDGCHGGGAVGWVVREDRSDADAGLERIHAAATSASEST